MTGSEEGCGLCRAHPSGCFLPGPHATPPAGGRHAPRGLVAQRGREGGGIWRVRCSRGGWRWCVRLGPQREEPLMPPSGG